jgi:hypothetical protein
MVRTNYIKPYKGLKEILAKRRILETDQLEEVNSDDYKDFHELEE